jgi:hypothetical protein
MERVVVHTQTIVACTQIAVFYFLLDWNGYNAPIFIVPIRLDPQAIYTYSPRNYGKSPYRLGPLSLQAKLFIS